MMYAVRRLQQLVGEEKNVHMYVCFIDPQKTYDSVDRSLLWTVLARYGLPAKMISSFASSTTACGRLDNSEASETSEWSDVYQGPAEVM